MCLSFCSFVCHFVCTVTDFSAAEKDRGVKFACVLACYPDRSSPLLVNIGSRGVTGVAALSGMHAANDASLRDSMNGACGGSVGQSELGAAALLNAVW